MLAPQAQSQVLLRSAKGLAFVALLVLTPFTVNNFLEGRLLLGLGSGLIVAHLAFNAWTITRHDRYHHGATLVILVPALIFFLHQSVIIQGVIGILWCFPAAVSFFFMLPCRQAALANLALIGVVVPTATATLDPSIALRFAATLMLVVLFTGTFVKLLMTQEEELRNQAVTDPMTGLLNRSLLTSTLTEAIERRDRRDDQMTLLALDIDHFKRINDSAGHDVGDAVIQDVAAVLREGVRDTDSAFRIGGEEFVILMPATGPEGGTVVGERLRSRIEAETADARFPVTISVGIAGVVDRDTPEGWLKRTDEGLYEAKSQGRNRVVVAEPVAV